MVSCPVVAGGMVYIGSEDNNLYALNASTGTLVWNYTTGYYVDTDPTVVNGIVYVGSVDSNVYALNATTGHLVWTPLAENYAVIPRYSRQHCLDGLLDHRIYALNASNGNQIWNYTTEDNIISTPAVADGIVYFGSLDNNVYALNASNGKQVWNFTTGNQVFSSPAVRNGVVYVGSNDGKVYALSAADEHSNGSTTREMAWFLPQPLLTTLFMWGRITTEFTL